MEDMNSCYCLWFSCECDYPGNNTAQLVSREVSLVFVDEVSLATALLPWALTTTCEVID